MAEPISPAEDVDSRRARAVGHSRQGGLFLTQGKLAEAQGELLAGLMLFRRLLHESPDDMGLQFELAAARVRVCDVALAEGRLGEAQAEIDQSLKVLRRLVVQDPANLDWQRELAEATDRLAVVLRKRGMGQEARDAEERAQVIRGRLGGN